MKVQKERDKWEIRHRERNGEKHRRGKKREKHRRGGERDENKRCRHSDADMYVNKYEYQNWEAT